MTIEEIINRLDYLMRKEHAKKVALPDGFPLDEDVLWNKAALREAIALLKDNTEAQIGPGEVSDGYHTFNELYHHRAVLFSVICNEHPDLAWKSKHHHVGGEPMYDGMFIVGIDTPDGQATYHYDLDPYWDMFKVKELESAPEWDGYTPAQAIERIGLLSKNEPLTLEELRGMGGKPVWCEELQCWGIVKYETVGAWKNKPFLAGVWQNPDFETAVSFEYDIKSRGLTLYRRPPKED